MEGIEKVSDLITVNYDWDMGKLVRCFDAEIIEKIKKIHLNADNGEDTPLWSLNHSGKFSVKSFYNQINSNGNANDK